MIKRRQIGGLRKINEYIEKSVNENDNNIHDDYNHFSNEINSLENKKNEIFNKAMNSNNPMVIQKASNYFMNGKNEVITGEKIKSMLIDPMDFASSFGFKEKPTRLTYHTLKRMSQTPFTAITINTRVQQVEKFALPQPNDYSIGFKIRLKNEDKKPTLEEEKRIEELTEFILNNGFGGPRWGRDDFDTFLSKITRDSLIYDQYTFEVLEDKKGIPREFFATDASTYRIAIPDKLFKTMDYKPDPLTGEQCLPRIVQIYNGSVDQEFYPWELAFGIRRPRTDLYVAGYGYAELEELVNVITSMLYGDEYNRKFFSQGSAPKGILSVASDSGLSDSALKEFKREWKMQMSGVQNAWKTPIMAADKMNWIDLTKSNKDMEFTQWQYYNIKLHCALFSIDPSELGFDIQGSGAKGNKAMFESDRMSRIKYSKDKGLTPILTNISKRINKHLINRIDNRFIFEFVGNDIDEQKELDKTIKELSNFKTIDEARKNKGLDPIGKENGGDAILNPNYMSFYNNKILSQQNQGNGSEDEDGFGTVEEEYDPTTEDNDEKDFDYNEQQDFDKANKENPFVKDLQTFIKDLE